MAAAARLWLIDEAPVVVAFVVVALPLSLELLCELEVVTVPVLVVAALPPLLVVVLSSLEPLLLLLLEVEVIVEVMTMLPVPEDVVVVKAIPELNSAHSFEPAEIATTRSAFEQAESRQGPAKPAIALLMRIS